jgi:hypothetical protein
LTDALRLAERRTRIDFDGASKRTNATLVPLSTDEQRLVTALLRKLG